MSVLIALIILVPVIGLFVMTSPEKKVEQTMPTSTHVSKVKKNQKPKTTKTSETTPAVVKEAQPQSTVDTPTNNQTTTTSSTTTVNQDQNDSNQNNQAMQVRQRQVLHQNLLPKKQLPWRKVTMIGRDFHLATWFLISLIRVKF